MAGTLVLSCQNPAITPPGGGTTKLSATELVASIPTIETLLPKSLQAGAAGDSATQRSLSRKARAIGDVTALNPALLNGVTADGYLNLRRSIDNSQSKMILELLKYALKGKTVAFGEPYTIGVMELPEFMGRAPDGSNSMDLGRVTISNPSEGLYDVRWFIKFSNPSEHGASPTEVAVYLYIFIEGDDPATMKVKSVMRQEMPDGWFEDYSDYDAASNKMESIGLSPDPEYSYVRSVTTSNGYVTYYDISGRWKSVAYANDDMGGVVNWSKNNWGGVDQENIWTEFYNGQGDLVMNQWGTTSDANNGYLSWAMSQINDSSAMNMATVLGGSKPAAIYRKTVIKADNSSQKWSRVITWSSDNVAWTEQSNVEWSFGEPWPDSGWNNPVWKSGASAAAGDSIYYYRNGAWTSTSDGGGWGYTTTDTYEVGFTIPSPVSYLGKNYFIHNTFLLKHCRLPADMQGKYELKMKEESTWYNWRISNDQWTGSDSMPLGWETMPNNDKCSWTQYSYWLENVAYIGKDGADINDPSAQNSDKGDLPASNLSEQNFWLWENNESKQIKAQVVSTTEAQPVGFDFLATSLVSSVKNQIENVYQNEVPSLEDLDLPALAAQIATMPELASFPSY